MRYEYKEMVITLTENEVYMLNDLLLFALDYDYENHYGKLNDEKRLFANRLIEITKEDR